MKTLFLNSHRGKSGVLNGERLPDAYVLACKFFDCGIIDRSGTLDLGFDHQILDPIPAPDPAFSLSFADVCDAVAHDILDRAEREDRQILLTWSGGIDSTVALVAFLKAAEKRPIHRLKLLLSMDSIEEYPWFFRRYVLHHLPFQFIKPPITDHFGNAALIVTGEHGDQLFGSDKLLPLIRNGLCYEPYEAILPIYLANKFSKAKSVDKLLAYLEPQIKASPCPIKSTFELFWWLNYSLKWQQVTLRLPVFTFRQDVESLHKRFHHFFRDERFQRWSLNNHPGREARNLADYKRAAKEYLRDHTGDEAYHAAKTKEPSLKNVIINRKSQGKTRYRVAMGVDFQPIVETFHLDFKNQKIV